MILFDTNPEVILDAVIEVGSATVVLQTGWFAIFYLN